MKSEWYNFTILRYIANKPRNSSRKVLLAGGSLILILASTMSLVSAQTPDDFTKKSLEDLMNIEVESVYSASKYSQKVTEAPSSVSIVSKRTICSES